MELMLLSIHQSEQIYIWWMFLIIIRNLTWICLNQIVVQTGKEVWVDCVVYLRVFSPALLQMIARKFQMVCCGICGGNPAMVRHIISSIWNFQVSSAFTEISVFLSCIITYHNPLVVLTLKTIPSKMSSTIEGRWTASNVKPLSCGLKASVEFQLTDLEQVLVSA